MVKRPKIRFFAIIAILSVFAATGFSLNPAEARFPVQAQRPPDLSRVGGAYALNYSYPTQCAEYDNVNVPVFKGTMNSGPTSFTITATHPQYTVDNYLCDADFSGCPDGVGIGAHSQAILPPVCDKLVDNGIHAVDVCQERGWWLRADMLVRWSGQNPKMLRGERLVWYSKVAPEDYPQVMVLYQDGYMRLKPFPKEGQPAPCFGSSVLIGAAAVAYRPYAAIGAIEVDFVPVQRDTPRLQLKIRYATGEYAEVQFEVDRVTARADVVAYYAQNKGDALPFATLRSMYVRDTLADTSRVRSEGINYPVLSAWWRRLYGNSWFFYRTPPPGTHNQSAPDIEIVLNPG